MTPTERRQSIFRAEALRAYARGRDEAIFPRLIAPRVFALLWLLVALLLLGLMAVWAAPLPSTGSSSAPAAAGSRTVFELMLPGLAGSGAGVSGR